MFCRCFRLAHAIVNDHNSKSRLPFVLDTSFGKLA
jgi:hypothetical protein